MARPSLALDNLRVFGNVSVVGFHSVLAYLVYLPAVAQPLGTAHLGTAPYTWQAFPIIDSARWMGFDLLCAAQDLYLIPLMFFLSGVFVWPSLKRKGSAAFLRDRIFRLGLPFALVVLFLCPLASYAAYCATGSDLSVSGFWQRWTSIPFWPSGPAWFLWVLLAFDTIAATLHKLMPDWGLVLSRLSSGAAQRPLQYVCVLATLSAVGYVPLAFLFGPWNMKAIGPLSMQVSHPLHYAVYFFAGAGVGAYGIERGLISVGGNLARRWAIWSAAAVVLCLLWMGLTGLTMTAAFSGSVPAKLASHICYAFACASICFAVVAIFVRFGNRPVPWCDNLKSNAYAISLLHYTYVLWMQYALLQAKLPAPAKALIVFAGALAMSWVSSAAARATLATAPLIGASRRVAAS